MSAPATGGDLPALAARFGTDKWGSHWYAQHYERHFAALRGRPLRVRSIGPHQLSV